MVMKNSLSHIVQSGRWKQSIAILNDGHLVGFVERERTPEGRFTKTRNLRGEVMDGACLEWLLRQTA